MALKVQFFGRDQKAKSPANPDYPNGIDIDLTAGRTTFCSTALKYPAACIGVFLVTCGICGSKNVISAAGRVDDPRSVKIPCKRH